MYRNPRSFGFYSRSPWRDIEQLQQEMNRLFNSTFTGQSRIAPDFPAINIWTNEDGAVVTAELPGVTPEDIDISVVGETLTLSGNRQPEALNDGGKYHRRERRFGSFSRSFQLPFMVEADDVEAIFENGILHISLPRSEAEKPRKIAVKTA